MEIPNAEIWPIKKVKENKANPRFIRDEKFYKLIESIKEFPQMLLIRPIVVNKDNMVLGGNMRLRACKEAGLTEVPVLKVEELTEAQQSEFIIKDNASFGQWDWEVLEEKGIKQIWLEKQLGKSYNMVNSYARNRRQPSIEDLFKIAKILNVNAKELLVDINNG